MTSPVFYANQDSSRVEPMLLVEEISHRVVNELTIAIASLSQEAGRIADADARAALHRVAGRLAAFADAHRALQSPDAASAMNLGGYLTRLFAALSRASLHDHSVKLIMLEDEVRLAPERSWRVGLIIAELVTNSLKHGGEGRDPAIVAEVEPVGAELRCAVTDDGGAVGNPPPSRGRRVVERLAAELGGDIRWTFRPNGVTAVLTFPLSPDDHTPSGAAIGRSHGEIDGEGFFGAR
jgi:two-component sensor histidine kinase